MSSFDRLATVTASTKRDGGITNGLEVGYAAKIATLSCSPLDPIDAEIAQRVDGLSFGESLQTFVQGDPDIKEGDLFVVDTVEYPVRAVAEWNWKGTDYLMIYLEVVK